jgi:nucleotide-binding universal stress UspA family protein
MFDKILLAVGGSDASLQPARVTGVLAKRLGAQVTIVSVYRHTSPALGDPYYSERSVPRMNEAQQTIEEAAALVRAEGAADPELDALEGDPTERIANLARWGGFGLVVMGTHRRGRLGAALLGSVSGGVAARAGVPVMVVPEQQAGERS